MLLEEGRAVTNFSSRRGIVKSSWGTKKVWCYSHRLLQRGRGGGNFVSDNVEEIAIICWVSLSNKPRLHF